MGFLKVERAVIRSLNSHLGIVKTMRVLLGVVWGQISYRPFSTLEKPTDAGERLARAHVRDALILYRALLGAKLPHGPSVFEAVMTTGAQAFLKGAIGVIDREKYQRSTQSERLNWIQSLIQLFPNATATVVDASETRVAFSVTRCRYVELAVEAGHPEIATTFCAGDAAFFQGQPAGIAFNRAESIAQGDPHCPFELTLIEARHEVHGDPTLDR
jgi:hypothetical protein